MKEMKFWTFVRGIFWGKTKGDKILSLVMMGLTLFALVTWSYLLGFWDGEYSHSRARPLGIDRKLREIRKNISRKTAIVEHEVGKKLSAFRRWMKKGNLYGEAVIEERERLANWKANFPWKATTDPALSFDSTRHVLVGDTPHYSPNMTKADFHAAENDIWLRRFFQNEARFTKQFEQFYHILDEYNWTRLPAQIGFSFDALWWFQKAKSHDPNDPALVPNMVTNVRPIRIWSAEEGKVISTGEKEETTYQDGWEYVAHSSNDKPTWGEVAQDYHHLISAYLTGFEWRGGIVDDLEAENAFLDVIRNRLIAEVEGMTEIPDPDFWGISPEEEEVLETSYKQAMAKGDPRATAKMLVPYVGWFEEMQQYESDYKAQIEKSR